MCESRASCSDKMAHCCVCRARVLAVLARDIYKQRIIANMKKITLQGANNIRDLGGTPVIGGGSVKYGILFRGSALHAITEADQNILFNELGIKVVYDLRTGWERDKKPDLLPANVEYKFNPFYDINEVGIEYTQAAEGTKSDGKDIACDPCHYYTSLANPLTVGQMKKGVHNIFADICAGKPVYEHCSGGKDRAGIMALCLLHVLGVSEDAILQDYIATNIDRDANITPIYERFLRLCDGDEDFAWDMTRAHSARAENIDAFYSAVAKDYESMKDFIHNQLGVTDEFRKHWQSVCVE